MKLVRFGESGRERPGLIDARRARSATCRAICSMWPGRSSIRMHWPSLPRSIPKACRWSSASAAHRPLRCRHRQVHLHRAQLFRPCRRDQRHGAARADHLHEGDVGDRRPGRRCPHPARLRKDRLGGRARRRHRPQGEIRLRGGSARLCRRLLRGARRFRARLPDRAQGQWTKGKSCDTFGPIGPWLVTKDEVADPQNLPMWLTVDGQKMQNGSTKTMVYGVRLPGLLSQPVHVAAARRHHLDRHAARRRHGHEATALPEGRRGRRARHRRARQAAAAGQADA